MLKRKIFLVKRVLPCDNFTFLLLLASNSVRLILVYCLLYEFVLCSSVTMQILKAVNGAHMHVLC